MRTAAWPRLLCVAYVLWALAFIDATAVDLPGFRAYCLFDDAMISLRYAWNLAHGQGLVFNPGERVEGFTNLLTTLSMSVPAALLDRSRAVLAVQLMGLATMVGVGWTAWLLGRRWGGAGAGVAAMAATFAYYPLSFWTLMGMETGLVTLLVTLGAVRVLGRGADPRPDLVLALVGGALPLARPDGVVPAAVLLALRAWALRGVAGRTRAIAVEAAPLVLALAAVTAFRVAYYGSWVPNTYVLKVAGVPLGHRLVTGARFVGGFLADAWPWMLLAAIGWWRGEPTARRAAAAVCASLVAYTVWTGGDPWPYWRMLCPLVPLLGALAWTGARVVASRLAPAAASTRSEGAFAAAAFVLVLAAANRPYAAEVILRAPAFTVEANRANVADARVLAVICRPDATVGVAWAGALPYYTGLRAIDFLGKTDPHVARRPPDLAFTLPGVPAAMGHNKYDLAYSIGQLRPDVVQTLAWGRDQQWHLRGTVYVPFGEMWLRRDSPRIRWELIRPGPAR